MPNINNNNSKKISSLASPVAQQRQWQRPLIFFFWFFWVKAKAAELVNAVDSITIKILEIDVVDIKGPLFLTL